MRWLYLAIVVVFIAALIIFVFQNTQSVGVSFLALGITLRRAERRQPLRASATLDRRFAPRLKGRRFDARHGPASGARTAQNGGAA